ncbi:MAG: recombinase family protein [Desulfobulbaceae bacterium]|nr:recombinase family protein [Desulfobulbaceae bacterium]
MNCAVYIRKSREEKDKESHRLTVQREQLPAYAKTRGWTVEIYDDGHASAARGKAENLPERSRLETDIKKGLVNIILVIELSRLSRDDSMQDYVRWLDLCAVANVQLATTSQVLNPADPDQWTMLVMSGGFGAREMKVLQSRMKEGRDQALVAGKWLGGTPPPPYVYDKALGKPVVELDKLEEMRRLWKLTEKLSAKAVAEKMEKPEIFVRRAISDDRLLIYQALRTHPETGETIKCAWDPVMSAEQAARIANSRRTRKTNGARREFAGLLSAMDKIHCGYCGRTVKTWTNSKNKKNGARLNYYCCQTKNRKDACPKSRMIPQPSIDERVIKNVLGTIANATELKYFWELTRAGRPGQNDLDILDKEEQGLLIQKNNLVMAISNGVIEMTDAKEQIDTIKNALTAISTKKQDIIAQRTETPDFDAYSLSQREFNIMTDLEKREYLRSIIKDIQVYKSYLIIYYPFPRNADGSTTARIHLPPAQRGKHAPKSEKTTS